MAAGCQMKMKVIYVCVCVWLQETAEEELKISQWQQVSKHGKR